MSAIPCNLDTTSLAGASMPPLPVLPLPSRSHPLPMVIGHRGAKEIAPENTIAAIRAAKAVGATCVEVDVMLTKDGVPVIHHDNSVDRCTNGKGHVSEQTWQEIQLLDAGSYFCPDFEGERIPTLTELVEECTSLGLGLNIEIKHSNDDATVPASAEELQRERDLAKVTCQTLLALDANPERVFLSSFSIAALEVAQQMLPHFKRSYLVEDIPAGWEETVRRLGCVSFNFNWKKASREQVEACARTGVPLYAYTVNDPEVAEQLISWGLSGVFSDCPHEVRRHLWKKGVLQSQLPVQLVSEPVLIGVDSNLCNSGSSSHLLALPLAA